MHSIRRSIVLVVIGAAAAALADAFVSAVASVHVSIRDRAESASSFAVEVGMRLLAVLRLFAAPAAVFQKLPVAWAGLTARQRHDIRAAPTMRPTVSPHWRLVPST